MDFTREPIIETVITPKEGCKLVVRSSKSNGQEEHFVDALEVVSFGHSFFFRSLERPKTFLVPVTDYEVLEVREARMVLKNVGIDRAIKIGGGREAPMRTPREREPYVEKDISPEESDSQADEESAAQPAEKAQEGRVDKKRDRRRNYRRRRGRDGTTEEEGQENGEASASKIELQEPHKGVEGEPSPLTQQILTTSILTSLLPPPPTLISETIGRYKDNALFKDAFYTKEERNVPGPVDGPEGEPLEKSAGALDGEPLEVAMEVPVDSVVIPQPEYGTFEVSEEEEEEIYLKRKQQIGSAEKKDGHSNHDDQNHEQGDEKEHHGNVHEDDSY